MPHSCHTFAFLVHHIRLVARSKYYFGKSDARRWWWRHFVHRSTVELCSSCDYGDGLANTSVANRSVKLSLFHQSRHDDATRYTTRLTHSSLFSAKRVSKKKVSFEFVSLPIDDSNFNYWQCKNVLMSFGERKFCCFYWQSQYVLLFWWKKVAVCQTVFGNHKNFFYKKG